MVEKHKVLRETIVGQTVRTVEFFTDSIQITLSNGMSIEGPLTIPEDGSYSKEGQRLFVFLDENRSLIRGLYDDKWYKNGGWNGMMDAICEAQRIRKFKYDSDKLEDGEFDRIYEAVFK